MNAYEVSVALTLDTNKFNSGLDSAKSSASGLGDVFKGVFGANLVYDFFKNAASAIGDFAKATVDVGMNFEKNMSQVAATLGKTVDEMNSEVVTFQSNAGEVQGSLSDLAKTMGAETAFSANECAEALNFMALAGYDAQTSAEVLPNVLNLASAGQMDLAQASDMVTDALTAFGKESDYAETMVDQMAKTASISNTSVSQLGDAYLTVGGLAKNLKGGTAELSQVLAILADNGIKGSEAGTHLRNMLLKLSSPTEAGEKALARLGVSVYDAEGKMKPMVEVMGDLKNSLSNLTDEEKTQELSKIFNTRDIASATALLDTNRDRWDELAISIAQAGGSAEAMAETQLDNLAGDITLFQSALEGLQVELSTGANQSLREFVQLGTDGLGRMLEGFKTDGFKGMFAEMAGVITDGLNLILEMSPQFLDAGMEFVFSLVDGVLQSLPKVLETGYQLTLQLIQGITERIPDLVTQIKDVVIQLARIIAENAPLLLEAGLTLIQELGNALIETIPELIPVAMEVITGLVNSLVEFLPMLIDVAIELMLALIDGIVQSIPDIVAVIPDIIEAIVEALVGGIPQIIEGGIELLLALIDAIPVIILALTEALPEIISAIVSGLIGAIPQILQAGIKLFTAIVQAIPKIIVNIVALMPQVIASIVSGLGNGIARVASKAGEVAKAIINKIKALPSQLKSIGGNLITGLWNGINDKVAWIKSKIQGFGKSVISAIKGIFGVHSPSRVFRQIGNFLDEGLALGIEDGTEDVIDNVESLANGVTKAFSADLDANIPDMKNIGSVGQIEGTEGNTINYGGTTINVYAPEGMDINALAEVIQQKINNNINRRLEVWA